MEDRPITHDELTPAEQRALAREKIQERLRAGIKAVLEEEMSEHLQAGYREQTPHRRGERNGHYRRSLVTEVGRIEQLKVPRDREGTFLTEVFERYHRMTGSLEEAILEMYLQGISTRKIERVTGKLSGLSISKDAVSRTAAARTATCTAPTTTDSGAKVAGYANSTYVSPTSTLCARLVVAGRS